MVTGIEIAGLTISAFPLAIEAIKLYSNGIRTVKDMKNYQQVLRQFARDLDVESCKFENNCMDLLSEFLSPEQVNKVMEDPGGDDWNNEEFLKELKGRLRSSEKTFENWLCRVRQLHDTLAKVAQKFQLPMGNGKRSILRKSAKFDPRQAWDVGLLTSYRDEHISKIRQWNMDLDTLAYGGKKALSGSMTNSQASSGIKLDFTSLITYHKQVQRHARFLYHILKEKLEHPSCRCTVPHTAHLELEMRRPPSAKKNSKFCGKDISNLKNSLKFKFAFSNGDIAHEITTWQEFQLEHIDDSQILPQVIKSPARTEIHSLAFEDIIPSRPLSSASSLSSIQERGRPLSRGSLSTQTSTDTTSIADIDISRLTPSISSASSPTTAESTSFLSVTSIFSTIKQKFWRSSSPSPNFTENTNSRPITPTSPQDISKTCSPRAKRARFADDDILLPQVDTLDIDQLHPRDIECFCTIITESPASLNSATISPICVGLLVGIDTKKHRVWLPSQSTPPPSRLVSLAELMTTLTDLPSRKNRRILGVKLMSSILQLSSTEWLTEAWGVDDILFPTFDPSDPTTCILSRPFVHQKFNVRRASSNSSKPQKTTSSNKQQANQAAKAVTGCNQNLYSLGIVLLELWHWQRFHALRARALPTPEEPDCLVAYRLSDQLFDEAGHQYSMAVRRCIRGLDMFMPKTDLGNDAFRKEVYLHIMGPLEDDLKTFCQSENLKEIMGEE